MTWRWNSIGERIWTHMLIKVCNRHYNLSCLARALEVMSGAATYSWYFVVFFLYFRLPIGLHSSSCISPTTTGTFQNEVAKYHKWVAAPLYTWDHWEDNQPARFSHSKRLLVSKFTHEQWATSDLVCLQLLYCLHFIIISGALKGGLRVYGLPICGFHSRAGTWCVKFYSKQANYLGISVLYYICAPTPLHRI